MSIKVLVVDDSSFFRRRVSEILNQDSLLEVIGTAQNGREAIEQTLALKPDVITMDVEMPVMDGITAVKEIMKQAPTPILMFSSLTHDGASATLDALDAGALDFLPKKFEDIARDKEEATQVLQLKVREIGRRRVSRPIATPRTETRPITPAFKTATINRTEAAPTRSSALNQPIAQEKVVQPDRSFSAGSEARKEHFKPSGKNYKIVAIGTSTGGPVALQNILTQFPAEFKYPILLIQHMPAAFTPAFATRLNSLCQIEVKEAVNGDILRPGVAYLAPGGKQMMIEGKGRGQKLKVIDDHSDKITYKPSVDITFGSAAKSYGDSVLAVVLTGMGADGREGARMLKQAGSKIWAQDEKTSIVYGMPQAVTKAGLTEANIPLPEVANRILRETGHG